MSANTLFFIHLAAVIVPVLASIVLYGKCLGIAQDLPLASDERFPRTAVGVVLRASRTTQGWWCACGFVFAQVALLVALYSWGF